MLDFLKAAKANISFGRDSFLVEETDIKAKLVKYQYDITHVCCVLQKKTVILQITGKVNITEEQITSESLLFSVKELKGLLELNALATDTTEDPKNFVNVAPRFIHLHKVYFIREV